jgi:hypothetical protein
MMVEPVVGHCPFTDDPRRHMITESTFTLSSTARLNTLLPDQKTAGILAESFFVNVGCLGVRVQSLTVADSRLGPRI